MNRNGKSICLIEGGRTCGLFILIIACVALSLAPRTAMSQNPAKSTLQLAHRPITAATLPSPGQPLILTVEVAGSREISLPIRIVAVRDGRLIPIPLNTSYRNAADRPVYEFQIPSPLAELSYQFVLPLKADTVIATQRYSVRRPCIPALDTTTAGNANQSELEKMAVAARVLEQEIEAYSAALSAAEQLQREVNEQ
jgi:hypothetical protein